MSISKNNDAREAVKKDGQVSNAITDAVINGASNETIAALASDNSVPPQKTETKVTVVKDGGVDGKDVIVVSEEIVDEASIFEKAKGVFMRNRKLILSVAAATTAAVLFAVFRDVEIDSDEPSSDSEDSAEENLDV